MFCDMSLQENLISKVIMILCPNFQYHTQMVREFMDLISEENLKKQLFQFDGRMQPEDSQDVFGALNLCIGHGKSLEPTDMNGWVKEEGRHRGLG